MNIRIGIIILSLLCVSLMAIGEEAWMVGVAVSDITPPTGIWLAGYAMREHPADGVIHSLWVKAMAIQDAQKKTVVIISSDILGFPAELSQKIKRSIKDKKGIEPADIILNSSHTHSGPVIYKSLLSLYPIEEGSEAMNMIKDYTNELENKVVDTIVNAIDNIEPAKLYRGNGIVRFAVNRRNNNESKIEDTYDLKGPIDHTVTIIVSKNAQDGSVQAIVFGYACHATTLSGYQWCGDYPGFAQIELEKIYPATKALFVAGCGADINPLPRRTVALAQQYGKELACAVVRAMEDTLQELKPSIKTCLETVDLPLETPITKEELMQIYKDNNREGYIRRSANDMLKDLEQGIPLPTSYPYPIQVWNIGGLPMIVLGGEVVVDYAIRIKQEVANKAMVLGYSNDLMSYIPSARIIKEGGYEGDTSQLEYKMPAKWKEEIEELIINTIARLWNQIK
ncbi:MAG TPA: neutral/alkaline non-lysosomal ceramidase N-terminal domain-containing protein [Candidatus Hydrogenedens sp.]|nr:neutral/alkaline non-lysosomal ceramidase N-terminal domain-containing protein [Candidatus Hydrogenedens sp.]